MLLGGLEQEFYDFPYELGMSSTQLLLTHISQRGWLKPATRMSWDDSLSRMTPRRQTYATNMLHFELANWRTGSHGP
jgi:hypothetical protein